jgi:hypothetical protein
VISTSFKSWSSEDPISVSGFAALMPHMTELATDDDFRKFGKVVDLKSVSKDDIDGLFKSFGTGEKSLAFMEGLVKHCCTLSPSMLTAFMPHLTKFATDTHWEKFGKSVRLGSASKDDIDELFKNFETEEKRQSSFIKGIVKNHDVQDASVLTALIPHLAKFATYKHWEKFGEKVNLGSYGPESEIKANFSNLLGAFRNIDSLQAFIGGIAKNHDVQDASVLTALIPHMTKFATNEHWKKFGEKVNLGLYRPESEIKANFSKLLEAFRDVNEAFSKAFMEGLAKNDLAQYASVLTMLMSSPLGKFVANEHWEKFAEKVNLKQSDVGELFAAIGKLEENENNNFPHKAFMEGLAKNDLAQYAPVFIELIPHLTKFATDAHWEKFGEKVNLNQSDACELFAVIGNIEENENNMLKRAFMEGLQKNDSTRDVCVLTALMASSLGKFATNTHLEKFGEKISWMFLMFLDNSSIDELFAAIGNGEEAKERKRAFLKGVESNSRINSWVKEYMNKLMEEGK